MEIMFLRNAAAGKAKALEIDIMGLIVCSFFNNAFSVT
jgi:hypothetical protein